MKPEKILVVCLGNICRSPTGERLLQHYLPQKIVRSAGLAAVVNGQAHPVSRRIAAEHQISLDNHRPQQLTAALMDEFDLILVMEEWQRLKAQALNPQAAHKVELFADKKIPDPYGHDEEAFRRVFKQMDAAARRWAEELGQ